MVSLPISLIYSKKNISSLEKVVFMKRIDRNLITCNWCYKIYLVENKSDHYKCFKAKVRRIYRVAKSVNYDQTEGQVDDRTNK